MFINLFDSHMHSDLSPDGVHSPTHLCEQAVSRGLVGISITDHCEVNSFYKEQYDIRLKQSVFAVSRAKSIFKNQLVVTQGMELGQPLQDLKSADVAIATTNFDFILGSVHNVEGDEDFCFLDYDDPELNLDGFLKRYFMEIYNMAVWNKFDVLAHLTYPLRYFKPEMNVDISKFDDIINGILKTLVVNSKGIEINTSGLYRKSKGLLMPEAKYIKRYKELGGEIVTIGSDAHRAEHVGNNISDGMQVLQELGFEYFAFYKNRKPTMLKLL